ncbi:hypothetical protein DPX16_8258 [Anabarilius grahami]|uniref:Uncharacterized protein n=1 Tax=Anabarilius grahami TaxID=495550 RepID=A0A3N0Y855_ANAGA|nr:hypothetical protein DPX16_8258 [Anabarilius grahami]
MKTVTIHRRSETQVKFTMFIETTRAVADERVVETGWSWRSLETMEHSHTDEEHTGRWGDWESQETGPVLREC